ncbi:MAG TPA: hypothetical protein PKB10_15430, partial [Tepidisphaeraceae bacterium]|nr:hypothetical protein [Tepidisphaeraceae bacterium]
PPKESVVIYGCAFLGACVYFGYALLRPVWGNAVGQLLAFLVYDLMLLVPFIRFFDEVKPEMRLNHIVYFGVVSCSAVLAIIYCLLLPRTRLFDRRR